MLRRSHIWLIVLTCSSIVLLDWGMSPVACQEANINAAVADISLCWGNYTIEDSVSNLPITWIKQWYFRIVNTPDEGQLPISNPNVTIETDLDLVGLYPLPTVSNPPYYQWVYDGAVAENYWFLSGGFENESWIDRPRFSASRDVSPQRLRDVVTNQTVQITFKLEESLPPEVNMLAVTAGFYPIATEHPLAQKLVDYEVLEWSSPDGWEIYHHGTSAIQWTVFNVSEILIGETHRFNVTFCVEKSEQLEGSPISKPFVEVIWRRIDTKHHGLYKSLILEHPEGVRAIFQADEELDWASVLSSSHRHFSFMSRVTSIVGEDPPFCTLSELVFTLHSSADLHVYDGLDRHVGLNYETNETEALIPHASFEVMNGDQIITIPEPLPGNYSVILVGTSSGPYELTIEAATETDVFYEEKVSGLIEPGSRRETGVSIPRTVGMIVVNELPTMHTLVPGLILLGLAIVLKYRPGSPRAAATLRVPTRQSNNLEDFPHVQGSPSGRPSFLKEIHHQF